MIGRYYLEEREREREREREEEEEEEKWGQWNMQLNKPKYKL